GEANKDVLEEYNMTEDELKSIIVSAVKEALTSEKEEVEVEVEPEGVELEPESVEIEAEPEEEVEVEVEPEEVEPDTDELIQAQKRIKELEQKLGEGQSQSIKGQDTTQTPQESRKYTKEDGRDIYGRRI
ncbi:MAG: hypothetical protein Q8M92_10455, partial [Candidatus Subteraquimicrobiales bacterium]|nr:hypothetical protein [Candidatus Subteraquimicrobiales bacterium]